MNAEFDIDQELRAKVINLSGPILIIGAGGFIGINLLQTILRFRKDVVGVSQDIYNNWRFLACSLNPKHLKQCDINDIHQVQQLLNEIPAQTIFNLAAYGAYSKQSEYDKIYQTNFIGTVDLIEQLKIKGFKAFIQAGSSSEYGRNSNAPLESAELKPNSHYAVSKVSVYNAIKYYGKIENLPIIHLRLYSVYGPFEEPDRLIPVLLSNVQKNKFPLFVDGEISRDFIYITDVIEAFIDAANEMKPELYGEAFNIGSGTKTSIRELAYLTKDIFQLKEEPEFGTMQNRNWDLADWYSNPQKANSLLKWKSKTSLKNGLLKAKKWQETVDFNNALWNWTRL